jgi:CHAT domain-containing protein
MYGIAELNDIKMYVGMGKLALAEQAMADAFEISERELQRSLQVGTEADHAMSLSSNRYELDTVLNFELDHAPRSPSVARLGLTTLLRRKGRALDAAASDLGAIRARLSPEDRQLLDDLASARAQLARLTVAGPSATDGDYAREVKDYEDQIQKLEIRLGKKSAAYRIAGPSITAAAVQQAIPRDARLVEITSFQTFDPKVRFVPTRTPPRTRYAAYVVGKTGDPVLVDLGPTRPIDDAIEQLREAMSDPRDDRARERGHQLYALTMAKIAPALGGATSVLIAPDGALNVVPFAALVDDHGEFLIQRFTFTYLTSGRDLLRLTHQTRPRSPGAIFADPAFDAAPGASAATSASRGRRSNDLARQTWKPLPGTAQEADEIVHRLPGLAMYRGARATETVLKALHGPRLLHLATHGFFLDDQQPFTAAPSSPSSIQSTPSYGEAHENPLLRAGLVLAGANQLASGDDDGILTAMEASSLDLAGTQIVVLSACETGVGKVTNGEGVYGLRRALVIAGAESLVMSLWPVDDDATRDLMAGFYARLATGAPRSSALRAIQLAILARPRYAHPFYWASFLPTGNDAPLQ